MLLLNNNPVLWNFGKVVGKWEADLSAAAELNVPIDGHNIFIVTCAREGRRRPLFRVRSHVELAKLFWEAFWQTLFLARKRFVQPALFILDAPFLSFYRGLCVIFLEGRDRIFQESSSLTRSLLLKSNIVCIIAY